MAKNPDPVRFTDSTGHNRDAYRWMPADPPRASIIIVHGMGEHIMRYQHVAAALTDAGYAVYGYDLRGHGTNITAGDIPGQIGTDGWTALVADIGAFTRLVRHTHPGLKLGVLAHSMGSFAVQQSLPADSHLFDAIALFGTAAVDLLVSLFGLDLDAPIEFSPAPFNAAFQPVRTTYDWLTRDSAVVDAYIADPLCGLGIDAGANRAQFDGAARLAQPDALNTVAGDLPVYLATGEMDPVNAGLALFIPLVDRFRDAGLRDVTSTVYPGARHELLNETNRVDVIGNLISWLTDRLG